MILNTIYSNQNTILLNHKIIFYQLFTVKNYFLFLCIHIAAFILSLN